MSERETVLWNELWSCSASRVEWSGPEDTVERRQFVYTRDGEGGHWRLCDRFETVCVTAHLARELTAARGEVERLKEAMLLVMAADNHERSKRGNPHLGRARWSGMEQGCVQCIAAMALGESGDTPTAEAFAEARAALAPAAEAPPAAKEGGCGCDTPLVYSCGKDYWPDDSGRCNRCGHLAACHPRPSEGAP